MKRRPRARYGSGLDTESRRPRRPTPICTPRPAMLWHDGTSRGQSGFGADMGSFSGSGLACMRGERWVFTGLGFALGVGGALVLTGPNGSGKSSLLRIMAGLGRLAGGEMTWDGAPIAAEPEAHRARVQYVGHLDG